MQRRLCLVCWALEECREQPEKISKKSQHPKLSFNTVIYELFIPLRLNVEKCKHIITRDLDPLSQNGEYNTYTSDIRIPELGRHFL